MIGSTEQPWLMASSLIDVFEKRIYVPMPDSQSGSGMFQFHLRCLSNETSPVIPNSLTPNDIRFVTHCIFSVYTTTRDLFNASSLFTLQIYYINAEWF